METNKNRQDILPNINKVVTFAKGHLAEVFKNIELNTQIPLAFRSTTGEVVVKTDYFNGPCSIIRGTDLGKKNCRNTYRNIEQQTLVSKSVEMTVCYAGFVIISSPALIRDEIVGTILASQILPLSFLNEVSREFFYSNLLLSLGINNTMYSQFFSTFNKVKYINLSLDQEKFTKFFQVLGTNFESLALSSKSWILIKNELLTKYPELAHILKI